MISAALLRSRPGPLARTRQEVIDIERRARFQRARLDRARLRLRESDTLLDLVEECRLRRLRPLPPELWGAVARLVGSVEPELRDELGIRRDAGAVSDALFAAQERLLVDAHRRRPPRLAEIIELFPRPPAGED